MAPKTAVKRKAAAAFLAAAEARKKTRLSSESLESLRGDDETAPTPDTSRCDEDVAGPSSAVAGPSSGGQDEPVSHDINEDSSAAGPSATDGRVTQSAVDDDIPGSDTEETSAEQGESAATAACSPFFYVTIWLTYSYSLKQRQLNMLPKWWEKVIALYGIGGAD